jgi:SAM-dependent methyltransferase
LPTLRQNLSTWTDSKSWEAQGDEWSDAWGGPGPQWQESILPRIRDYLPAGHILEIAPGFGRWTQFLAAQCLTLTLVDLSPQCIAACRQRFARLGHLRYHVNDGLSLSMLPDRSVDFAFSFDSLVHAELSVIESGSRWERPLERVLNSGFMAEAAAIRARHYPVGQPAGS